jgi:nitrogen fixation protein FixH
MLTSSAGEVTGVLSIDPFPPPVMNKSVLTLTLTGSGGHEIAGAKVQFDLSMPAMEMPENRVEAKEVAPGRYQAEALFTMAGEWQIDAEVSGEAGDQTLIFLLSTQ